MMSSRQQQVTEGKKEEAGEGKGRRFCAFMAPSVAIGIDIVQLLIYSFIHYE